MGISIFMYQIYNSMILLIKAITLSMWDLVLELIWYITENYDIIGEYEIWYEKCTRDELYNFLVQKFIKSKKNFY